MVIPFKFLSSVCLFQDFPTVVGFHVTSQKVPPLSHLLLCPSTPFPIPSLHSISPFQGGSFVPPHPYWIPDLCCYLKLKNKSPLRREHVQNLSLGSGCLTQDSVSNSIHSPENFSFQVELPQCFILSSKSQLCIFNNQIFSKGYWSVVTLVPHTKISMYVN